MIKNYSFLKSIPKESSLSSAKSAQDIFCKDIHPIFPGINIVKKDVSMMFPIGLPLINSVKMTLISTPSDFVSRYILNYGYWEILKVNAMIEKMEEARVKGIINPVFLDIGSNLGYSSIVMASRGYTTISIDAMKSNGDLYKTTLCENPDIMQRITFVNSGLGNKTKTCFIASTPYNSQNGNVFCPDVSGKFIAPDGYVSRGQVNLIRLDELIKQDIYVMKVDVEGFEMDVLDGAKRLFDKYLVYYVLSEISDWMIKEKGRDARDYLRFWIDRGYSISIKGFNGPFLKFETRNEIQGLNAGEKFNVNIYCVHKSIVSRRCKRYKWKPLYAEQECSEI